MGVGDEPVVDPELRVHGIQNLRIAVASIMPEITTTNANAPSMMTGWKCGEVTIRHVGHWYLDVGWPQACTLVSAAQYLMLR
jgi:choline dehydrogenase-like flavoprotein